jgi:hypothetical protein
MHFNPILSEQERHHAAHVTHADHHRVWLDGFVEYSRWTKCVFELRALPLCTSFSRHGLSSYAAQWPGITRKDLCTRLKEEEHDFRPFWCDGASRWLPWSDIQCTARSAGVAMDVLRGLYSVRLSGTPCEFHLATPPSPPMRISSKEKLQDVGWLGAFSGTAALVYINIAWNCVIA